MKINIWRICAFLCTSWTSLVRISAGQKSSLTILDDRCITDASSAVAAIYDLSDPNINDLDVDQVDVLEVKSLKDNDGNGVKGICHYTSECFKTRDNDWFLVNSLVSFGASNLINDRRWEDFHTLITTKGKNRIWFDILNNSSDISIPFSMQAKGLAQVFFCDDNDNCYGFIFYGETVKFLMCRASECEISDEKTVEHKVSEESWSHFNIIKNDREIYLEDENGSQILIKALRLDVIPRILYFETVETGLWKIHNFWYYYKNKKTDAPLETKKPLTVSKGRNCLAMFVAMCESCSMEIKLVSHDIESMNEYIPSKTVRQKEWKEIKFFFDVEKQETRYLQIIPKWTWYRSTSTFWAVSHLRSCGEDEVRVLRPNLKLWTQKCQLIKSGKVMGLNIHKKISILENCTENQFGEKCFPCEKMFDDKVCPRGKRYCQLLSGKYDMEEKCYCSIGYKGSDCSEPCGSHTYGHGCRNSCANCKDGCQNDIIFGKCNSDRCNGNYWGEKCDMKNENSPPIVRNFKYSKTKSSVLLTWLAPVEAGDRRRLNYIVNFQHKSQACKKITNEGTFDDPLSVDNDTNEYLLENLDPYAEYYIEARVNTSIGVGPPVFVNFTTEAAENIEPEEIPYLDSFQASTKKVAFKFVEVPCDKMTGPVYISTAITSEMHPWCESKTFKAHELEDGQLTIEELKPFCKYNATFQFYRRDEKIVNEIATSFETLQGAPNKISRLEKTSKGPTHISLRWLPPDSSTGQLEKYKLLYCNTVTAKECENDKNNEWLSIEFKPSTCRLWPQYHCYKLTLNSITYSIMFVIKLRAKNEGSADYSEAAETGTIWADTKKESLPPYGLNMTWTDEYYLIISWYHPNLTNGYLNNFKIHVNQVEYNYKINSEDDYLLVYNKTITNNLTFPDYYTLSIIAVNEAPKDSEEALMSGASPPPVPVHQDYIATTKEKNQSIAIGFNQLKSNNIAFKQYLYVLITECPRCEESVSEYKHVLVEHHKTHGAIKSIESIQVQAWKAVLAFTTIELNKFSRRTLYIGNNTIDDVIYNIKQDTTYSVAFIWIHAFDIHIRMNFTIVNVDIGSHEKTPDRNTGYMKTGTIIFLIFFFIFVVTMMVVYIRWKKEIHIKAEELLDIIRHSNVETSTDLVQYENFQRHEEVTLIPNKSPMSSAVSRHMPETICPGNPMFKTKNSQRIKLSDFRKYVKNACESNELRRQHNLFPQGATRSWTYGISPPNKAKNRYVNMIAYNHSRVVLDKLEGDEHSDYINASYIDGYQIPRAYIATQGPKKATLHDFWRMIWQEKVTYIVMMANLVEGGKKKVEQYWPNNSEKLIFGEFRITFVSSEMHASFDYRKFQLHYGSAGPRQICQLHFKAWPDHGVPLYPQSLVPILEKMLTFRTADFPMVVHCSAGVGRTGTVILCDICLRMAASEGFVDALAMLEHLRNQRANMVDNVEQYKLAHLVVLDFLLGLRTNIPINKNFASKIHKKLQDDTIAYQLKGIRDCEWEDDAMKMVSFMDDDEEISVVPEKNRFSLIIPDNTARVFLRPYPPSNPTPSSTYINAVKVDAFCEPGRFIVTQYPLPNTVGDFWRLVAEKDISVIICLNDIPLKDESCGLFFPIKLDEISPEQNLKVKHIVTKSFQVYSVLTFQLTVYDDSDEESKPIEIVKFRGWKISQLVPDDYMDFVTFVQDATIIARKSTPTLVTCYDGTTACGLFIAMSFLLEKIKLEHSCDVCQAVRSIRTSRKEFVNTEGQLKFLYKASLLYVEEKFNTYANMNV